MSLRQHDFTAHFIRRWAPWWYCAKCGLVCLKNEATRRAMSKPCPGAEQS